MMLNKSTEWCAEHPNSQLDRGWCWECAVEVYGYDLAKVEYARIYGEVGEED